LYLAFAFASSSSSLDVSLFDGEAMRVLMAFGLLLVAPPPPREGTTNNPMGLAGGGGPNNPFGFDGTIGLGFVLG
jgi:hypothetical protein